MKIFIGGEDWYSFFERMTYDGVIGIFYKDTLNGILTYIIVALLCILAVIGLITVIRLIFRPLFRPKKSKMSAEDKWLKTGKW